LITYTVKIKEMEDGAKLPEFKTGGASCMDVYAAKSVIIGSMQTVLVPCGFAIEIPVGMEGQLRPRSGMSLSGLMVTLGTIDSDYRGEVGAIVTNLTGDMKRIIKGDRIAQLAICSSRTPYARFSVVKHLSHTQRGDGGFGSTGRS
jgi:dUTP pyrophosphatase